MNQQKGSEYANHLATIMNQETGSEYVQPLPATIMNQEKGSEFVQPPASTVMNQQMGFKFLQPPHPKKRRTAGRKRKSFAQPLVTLGGTAAKGSPGSPLTAYVQPPLVTLMNQEMGSGFVQPPPTKKRRTAVARKKKSLVQPLVTLGGTAAKGSSGPPLGLVDLGINANAYLLRVALPGVRQKKSKLKLNVEANGRVELEGVVAGSEFLKASEVKEFQMKVQELAVPGSFGVSFKLPGRIDPRLIAPRLMSNGILEVVFRRENRPF